MKSPHQTLPAKSLGVTALAILFLWLSQAGVSAESSVPPGEIVETGPVVVSREQQLEFTSRINGGAYRVMVSVPKLEPGKRYPVLYVLDGNWYFRATSDAATWGSGPFEPAIVVGFGYPTEEYAEVRRRRGIDMTLKGCDTFLRVIAEEIKPLIASRYPTDSARQMLYGKSLGGATVLRALLRSPESFSTYIAVSPAISNAVLEDEAAFSARARASELKLRLLITWGSQEGSQMITSARGLAGRLAALNPENVVVKYALFQDESHNSVSLASIARALTFALPAPPAKK